MEVKRKKSKLYKIEKAAAYFKHYGPVKLACKAAGKVLEHDDYSARWGELAPSEEELFRQRGQWFDYMPCISILVPVFDPPKEYLKEMLLSVLDQTYFNWKLCIVDAGRQKLESYIEDVVGGDTRVRYYAVENGGIAANTNVALAMATGDYIALLDNDDTLSLEALYRMVEMINKEEPDCLYSDEDKIDGAKGRHFAPNIKPDYHPALLRTNNYICHLFMAKLELAREVGGFAEEYDGAQDYDFILKCTERAQKVSHVPKILYHWRVHENSTSGNPLSKKYAYASGRKAIEAHLRRLGRQGSVKMLEDMGFYRVDYGIEEAKKAYGGRLPHVKVVVLGVADNEEAQSYFRYLRSATSYENISLCAMKEPEAKRLCAQECDYFMMLVEGTRFSDRDWLKRLVCYGAAEQADAVAARFVVGRFLGYGGRDYTDAFGRKHSCAKKPAWYKGYFNRGILQSGVDAIPKAGILVKKQGYGAAERRFVYEPAVTLSIKKARKG